MIPSGPPNRRPTGGPRCRRGVVRVAAAIFWVSLTLAGCRSRPADVAVPPSFHSTRDLPAPKGEIDVTVPSAETDEVRASGADGRVFGVQVLLFSATDEQGLDREMKLIADAGANTVIVRVFHNRGDRFYRFAHPRADAGVYFRTARAPVVDDVLDLMIRSAKRNGLSVWAWMTTRYAAWGEHADGLYAYDFRTKTILPVFGRDLFDDAEVEDLVGLYRDLAAYDIDGILLQDDLVLRHNEGMGRTAERLYGGPIKPDSFYVDPHPAPDGTKYYARAYTEEFWRWSRFKAGRLASVAGMIAEGVREVRPNVKCAVNLSYEAAYRPEDALAWLSEDIAEFKRASIDYFFIMAYHRQMMSEKGLPAIDAAVGLLGEISSRAVLLVGRPERVGIKLQIVDWDTGAPIGSGELGRAASGLFGIDKISLVFVPFNGKGLPTKVADIFLTARGAVRTGGSP
jgi:biofilm PGA synthesis lipoprotein PgaB